MDIYKALGTLFTPEGRLELPDNFTLPGFCEYFFDKQPEKHNDLMLRFHDYSVSNGERSGDDLDGTVVEFTYAQVNTRIKAVAARLQQVCAPGDHAAILANNSPEYIFGFLGAVYAGLVPVPLYDPSIPTYHHHLKVVLKDAAPTVVLTNRQTAGAVRRYLSDFPASQRPRALTIDALPDSLAADWVDPLESSSLAMPASGATSSREDLPQNRPAFLQYTSGSTRNPAGVILTHRSVMASIVQMVYSAQLVFPLRLVSWLPMHHDMGVIFSTMITAFGFQLDLMGPRDFLQQPKRWVAQLGKKDEGVAMYSAIPNFALGMAARFAGDLDVDLSGVNSVVIGGEPITEASLLAFFDTFAPRGFTPTMILSSYGLAEATLGAAADEEVTKDPVISHFDRAELAQGRAVFTEDKSKDATFVSVGEHYLGEYLTIVDPETRAEVPDERVGEIWVQGPNVAAGYFNRPEETEETFNNTLASRLENSRVAGAEDNPWLATGDLGVIVNNELYVIGRIKDLVVIAGVNHYPQDLEATVHAAAPDHIQEAAVAAFSIPGEDVEQLIIMAERKPEADAARDDVARSAISQAISEQYGIAPADIVLGEANFIARSSAGKIARRVARKAYVSQIHTEES